jgi:hypothetical protein
MASTAIPYRRTPQSWLEPSQQQYFCPAGIRSDVSTGFRPYAAPTLAKWLPMSLRHIRKAGAPSLNISPEDRRRAHVEVYCWGPGRFEGNEYAPQVPQLSHV